MLLLAIIMCGIMWTEQTESGKKFSNWLLKKIVNRNDNFNK